MADVHPFRGLRYNPQVVGELSRIICPPFDTIPPELHSSLYQRSPYNVVRLESGERLPSDTPQDNRYTRSAALLSEWIDERSLVREEAPAFYLVQHTFHHGGNDGGNHIREGRSRLELIACVRLEDYERRVVLPHEYTRDADKQDRLALMEACSTNFSPIMCLYRDEGERVSAVLRQAMAGQPVNDFSDPGGQTYKLWKIDDPAQAAEITGAMASSPLYIADGHHRYETALNYRDLMASRRRGGPAEAGAEAFNFVMMGLIQFDDPGLMVLPYHRVVGNLDGPTLERVRGAIHEFFQVERFPGEGQPGWAGLLDGFLEEIEDRGREQMVMGLLDPQSFLGAGPGNNGLHLLTLKEGVDLDRWGPVGRSEAWILEEQALRPILGDSLARCVDYIHDGDETERRVRDGEFQLGFFLKPFPLDLFANIMDLGLRLPPKSTFFYPKLPTGIVINPLEGTL